MCFTVANSGGGGGDFLWSPAWESAEEGPAAATFEGYCEEKETEAMVSALTAVVAGEKAVDVLFDSLSSPAPAGYAVYSGGEIKRERDAGPAEQAFPRIYRGSGEFSGVSSSVIRGRKDTR